MPPITIGEVGSFVDAIPPHAVRLLAGLDRRGLATALALGSPPSRPVLLLEEVVNGAAEAVVRAALAELGRALGALWPFLWDGEDFSDSRDDALTRTHLPIRLARLAESVPKLSRTWAVDAVSRLIQGRSPCRPGPIRALDWEQLVLALSPGGLVIAAALPRGEAATALSAFAWLADHAAVAVLLVAPTLPEPAGPFDRVLFGARSVTAPEIEACDGGPPPPPVLAEPEVEGRPHPLSAAELRLHRMIRADAELAPLFAFNRIVPGLEHLRARVDLLWAAGCVVVEIDGPEHRAAARYRADRQRDYELVCAGYRVLRFTNADVIDDTALTVARIRDVVRLSGTDGP